jgi:hypothetical protein
VGHALDEQVLTASLPETWQGRPDVDRGSTPVECALTRRTVQRSNLAGWAGYSYCAAHSRFFRGLRLHLIATPAGLPITWALAPANRLPGR